MEERRGITRTAKEERPGQAGEADWCDIRGMPVGLEVCLRNEDLHSEQILSSSKTSVNTAILSLTHTHTQEREHTPHSGIL